MSEYAGRVRVTSAQIPALREALKGSDSKEIGEFLSELSDLEREHSDSFAEFRNAYIAAAEDKWVDDEVNIDDDTRLSAAEESGGGWVMAWVWVDHDATGLSPLEEEEEEVA